MADTPSSRVQQLLEELKRRGHRADAYPRMYDIVENEPAAMPELLRGVMERYPAGGTFFEDAISFAPLEALASVAADAVRLLEIDENEAAEGLISRLSLQAPELLHPHLDALLRLRPNGSTYYAAWPWRRSGRLHHATLTQASQASTDEDDRRLAIKALFETREPEALARAVATDATGVLLVGFEPTRTGLRQLYRDEVWHLVFPPDYFDGQERPLHLQQRHPTWHLSEREAPRCRFGGEGQHTCAHCGENGHHLVSLPTEIGKNMGTGGALALETCLSCLGWEKSPLFYRHDTDGRPTPQAHEAEVSPPQFPSKALRETEIRICLTPARWEWQDWALSNSRENLNRIGGHPCWVQDADYPQCPECQQTMAFLLQLDSNLPLEDGREFLWGSGGIGYGFWCGACRISAFHWQCT